MSNSATFTPEQLLATLRTSFEQQRDVTLPPGACEWLLAQLKHKDDQIAALSKLARPTPAAVAAAPAESVCAEADRIVSGDRQASYGHPIYDFTRTARIWEVILDLDAGRIRPEQVGLCMIGVKLARELHRPKRDNLTDICGYAKTVSMIHEHAAIE